jgi:predicted RNase H-like nuclease (RuvC/YqgF family)
MDRRDERIKQLEKSVISMHDENQSLKQSCYELRNQVAQLTDQLKRLQDEQSI